MMSSIKPEVNNVLATPLEGDIATAAGNMRSLVEFT